MGRNVVHMTSKSGKAFQLSVPDSPRDDQAIFIVAAHKTGSTLMNRVTTELCERADAPHVNVELQVWRQGIQIKDWPDSLYAFLDQPGYIFDSFRSLQCLPEVPAFCTSPKIFLVRDPRDVAVSFYFSMQKSHTLPPGGGDTAKNLEAARLTATRKSIEEYVVTDECAPTLRNLERFCDFKDDSQSTIFRYEDIVFEKRKWAARLAELLGADLDEEIINEIADKNDIRPADEDASRHIRQVTPGNYKKHLTDRAISFLEHRYRRIFEVFGY